MKISIINVCLNAKSTIEDTFKSIFAQTCKDFELIVIDGGSTDGTLDIIKKYQDKIVYFVSEPDGGIYDAMNKGIKAATGDFVFFLNANDAFYDNSVLEKVFKYIKENPDAKILFGDAKYISDKETKTVKFDKIKNDFDLILNNICHQSIFYHKSLFEEFGLYDLNYKLYADWDFNLKYLVQNKVQAVYLPIIISNYQLGGISSNSKKTAQNEIKKMIEKYYPDYKILLILNNFLRRNFPNIYRKVSKICVVQNMIKKYSAKEEHQLNLK